MNVAKYLARKKNLAQTCLTDIVQRIYRKIKEQSVKSVPIKLRWDKP